MIRGKYVIGMDTGGTFTDITVLTETGEIFVDKAPTTPKDFSVGVMDAVAVMAKGMGLSAAELLSRAVMVKHGTTVATNALINRAGSKVGLVTTKNFEDTTLIMRAIGRVAGLSEDEIKHQAAATKPVPLVPKRLIKGVTERIDFRGEVVIPINLEEVREAIRSLVEDHHVEAIAVNFLFGFVNPVHENKVEELLREMYGEKKILLVLASRLVPVVREYARSNTTIISAFLDATVRTYINEMKAKLKAGGYKAPLLIMQANGGIAHEEEIAAVGLLESGPCGGMIATKYMADILGHRMVISTDMGGTSFDVSLLTDGYWRYAREPIVERFHITWPMIDIESIGAGGGTIARVDKATGRLMLGPNSAGAHPGPACYGLGKEPTVTDADLVLGLINPDYFLGGRMNLDKAMAERAIREKIADPLGMDVVQAAAGIYDIINGHMADLIRKKVVETGSIPEEHVIYAFGGAGPVHAASYSSDLGIKTLYVFPTSAVFSSFGITTADIIHTRMVSQRFMMPVDPEVLNHTITKIEEQLYSILSREGFSRNDVEFRLTFYMRYRRQLNELDVKIPHKKYDKQDIKSIMDEFEKKYEEVYGVGSAYPAAGIEIISFSVDAVGRVGKPMVHRFEEAGRDASPALKGTREVYFASGMNQLIDTKIYDFGKLKPGNAIEGPSIIETPFTTVVIPPKTSCRMDVYRNLAISL
jgi:N-methylhydantoinase A